MEAKTNGRFYASKYEAERLENGLKEKGWYVTDGSHEHFNLTTKEGGLIKFSKLARDAYKGFNVEIVNADNREDLCKYMNRIGNITIDDLVALSKLKNRVQFANYFMMSKRSVENWAYGTSKTPIHMMHLLEAMIRQEITDGIIQ